MARAILLAAVAFLGMSSSAQAVNELLSSAPSNSQWVLPPDGGEARISGRDARYPELDFDLAKLKLGPVRITIETDAPSFYVMPGRKRIKFDVSQIKHELVLDASGELKFDGKTDAQWNEDWKQGLAREGATSVTLRFSKCEFVKVNWEQTMRRADEQEAIDEPVAQPEAQNTQPIDAAPTEPALEGQAILDMAKSAVVELHVYRESQSVASVGQAVVVEASGLAVAPLHVVDGARRVLAKIAGVESMVEVNAAAWDTELDLALLQLNLTDPMARAAIRSVAISPLAPGEGEKLWLIGLADGQMRIDSTTVQAIVGYDELDQSIRKVMRHSVLSRWIVTTGTVPMAMAGGAALDQRGQLVGIPAWSWRTKSEQSALMSITSVPRLIEQRPVELATWDQLATAVAGTQSPRTTFPRLAVESSTDAQTVRLAGGALEQKHECSLCKGEGVLTRKVRAGFEYAGGLKTPVYQYESYTCTRCEGSGLEPIAQVYRQLSGLAQAIARSNPADPAMADALDKVRDMLRQMGQNHFLSLQTHINAEAKKTLGAGARQIGQPVTLVGQLVRTVEVPGAGQPAMGLKLSIAGEESEDRQASRGSETKVLLIDPRYVDRGQGNLAVVSGVLAGYVSVDATSAPMAVISHAMIVPIDEDKLIERKTADDLNKERESERDRRREQIERERERDRDDDDRNRD